MLETIQQTAVNTPWWVYALFIYLMSIGIKASQTRIVPLKKLFIIPILFAVMSVHTLFANVNLTHTTLSVWSVSILIGSTIGWLMLSQASLRFDKEKHLVESAGTWSTLIIILIIFASKYYFGYELSVDPNLSNDTTFEITMLGVSGICTGFFVGKLLCYLYRYSSSVHTDL